jgi:hypothetical protein
MRIATSFVVALAITIAMPLPVSAQSAEAEMLFREGKRLLKKGKIAEACEKFEASDRLEPKPGTELNIGNCREKLGQTSSAWAAFIRAAAAAKHAGIRDIAEEARQRTKLVEKKLLFLTISVPAENTFDELVIKRNQTSIDRALWNQAVPVDPDDYTIVAEAPDHTPWSVTVAVKTKNKVIEVPKLEREEHTPIKPDEVTEAPTRTDPVETHKPLPPKRLEPPRRYKSTVLALGAIGVGAFVIGTSFALYSGHLESLSDDKCPTINCTDSHAVDLNSSARTDGWIANISWGVGTVALAGAVAAWWMGSPAQSDTVSLVPITRRDQAGLAIVGRF